MRRSPRVTIPVPPARSPDEAGSFRSLIDTLGAIVWEAIPGDEPGTAHFSFVSEGTQAMLGYPASRWLEDPRFWFDIAHPDDQERVNAQIAEAARAGDGVDFEYRCLAADGREVWLRMIISAERSPEGPTRLRGVVVDVSGRRAAEERLQRLQELTGALSELLSAREVAAVVASQGRAAVGASAVAVFLVVSDEELEIAGYDGYALDDVEPFCRVPRSLPAPAAEAVRDGRPIFLSGIEMDERYPGLTPRRLAGTGQFVALPLIADGRVFGSIALRMPGERPIEEADRVVLDVLVRACAQALQRAEHVDAERAARHSAEAANAMLDTIIRTAPEGFALFDRELRYVRVNDTLARINGVPAEAHAGRTLHEIVPDIPDAGHAEPLRQVLETGEPLVDIEVTGRTAADPERLSTWLVSYYPVRAADGEIAWLGCFIVDITERKAAERRAEVLAELGTILDEVIGVEERLARLVDVCVPRVADTCSVLLLTDDGELERVAIRHSEPGMEPLLARVPPPAPEVVLGGTQVIEDVGPALYEQMRLTAEQRAVHEATGIRSAVLTPLTVRERHIGLLALGSMRPRAFGPGEARLAEELARRAALAVDNARLFESERMARDRTARLHAVAAALAEALTPSDVAAAILAEVVPAVGATRGSVFELSEDETAVEALAWRGVDDALIAPYTRISLRQTVPIADAVRRREPLFFERPQDYEERYPSIAGEILRGGYRASATVPLVIGGRVNGAMNLSFDEIHPFTEEERTLLGALAAQCAQALERARLFEQERRVAVTLQRSLLPARLPDVEELELDVRYLPAAGLEAGGDFYEALPLPDGRVGIAVGDVVGRGEGAAAVMGQLRSALRAYALTGERPAQVLRRLSEFAGTVVGAMAATAVYAAFDPVRGELTYACAGHPWPLLVTAEGEAEYLRGGRGVPLGCLPEADFVEDRVLVPPGATLLLYTDGLTERRGEDLLEVYERLRQAVAAKRNASIGAILDEVVGEVGADAPLDDVALLAVRRSVRSTTSVVLRYDADPSQVPQARSDVRDWLADAGAPPEAADDILLACGEAVANAVEHAYRDQPAGEVEVELSLVEPGVVAIAVSDHGRWKEPVAAAHRGRGFGLMRMLMQDVAVEQSASGTTVRMRRRIQLAAPVGQVSASLSASAPRVEGCEVELAYGVARLRGALDMASVESVEPILADAARGAGELTVDLTEVDYLDSAGGRLLLALSSRLVGKLIVVAPAGTAPRRALELSGLADLLDVRG